MKVHVGGVIVGMELLLFLYNECRFHLSEELLEGEVLRPSQVEHLHTAHNKTFNLIKSLNSILPIHLPFYRLGLLT